MNNTSQNSKARAVGAHEMHLENRIIDLSFSQRVRKAMEEI